MKNFILDKWVIKITIAIVVAYFLPTLVCPLLADAPCYTVGMLLVDIPVLGGIFWAIYLVLLFILLSAIMHIFNKFFGK